MVLKNFKCILFLSFLVLFSEGVFAQNVGINDTGANPNTHAVLDVDISSNDKGILIPRVTTAQRTTIAGLGVGDEGLMVYDETSSSFWYWNGTRWVEIVSDFNQEVNNSQSATTEPTGFSGQQTHLASPNMAIPDVSTINYNFAIVQTGLVADINVVLDIVHTFDSDLDITITSPSGTIVNLSLSNGGGDDNYQITTFDDEAATSIAVGSPPFNGSFRPDGLLSDFDGETITGTWIITITDNAGGDFGTLNDVSLVIVGPLSSWDFVGEAQITYKTGSTPVVSAYYSANPLNNTGCKMRVSRHTASGAGTLGTVLSYSAQAASGSGDFWLSMNSVVQDDAALVDGTVYYYKLWKVGTIEVGEENYSIVPILIQE